MRKLLPPLLFLLPGALAAQTASYTYIDQKTPYKNPGPTSSPAGPWLTALNLPKIGATFRLRVPATWSGPIGSSTTYWLGTGVRNPNWDLGKLWSWCGSGYVFTSADWLVLTPVGSPVSHVEAQFAIPNDTTLLGKSFYQQVYHAGRCFTVSRGGHAIIGS